MNIEYLLFIRKGSEGHTDLEEIPQRAQSHRSQLKRESSAVGENQAWWGSAPFGTVGMRWGSALLEQASRGSSSN